MKTITAICVVVTLTFIQIWSIYATTICNATFSTTTQDKNSLNQHKQTKYTALALEGGGVRGGVSNLINAVAETIEDSLTFVLHAIFSYNILV